MSLTSGKQLILTSAAGGGGYAVSRSLRFNSADSAYLNRTPASAGNRKTWTWAGWVKLGKLSNWGALFKAGSATASPVTQLYLYSDNTLEYITYSGSTQSVLTTSQVFRDPSAWYHIVLSLDTTQATANNRQRLYINGVEITAFASRTNHSQNYDTFVNDNTYAHEIGRTTNIGGSSEKYFDGYLADIHFIDGQALDPTSFGEFSATTGVWMPKAYVASGPNNGTTWSSTLSATGGVTNASNAFNGDLSTAALSVTDNASLIFDASSYSLSGTVRVFTPAIASGCTLRISANGGAYTETTSNSAQWTNLGNVGNISEIRVAINPANSADIKTPLAAIEVNGVVLINGNTSNIGVNGFHLEFADNSSNTATTLGKDTSGNGNNWTPNNFTVAAPAYSAPTNNNTPVYEITIGATNPLSGTYVWSNAFDGTTSTTGLIGPITFTGTKPTWSTSTGVELMADGNGITASVNGGSYVSLTNNAYVTISSGSSGTLNTIYIDSPTSASYIKSVRVDGVDISVKALLGKASDIDSLVDVPTNGSEVDTGVGGQVRGNYCTLSPLTLSNGTLSNGNLDWAPSGNNASVWSTFAVNNGKWYFEFTRISGDTMLALSQQPRFGGFQPENITTGLVVYMYSSGSSNQFYYNGSTAQSFPSGWGSVAANDIIGVLLDFTAGTIKIRRNNDSTNEASYTMPSALYAAPLHFGYSVTSTWAAGSFVWNFGARSFAYTAPSGFKALCTANLPAPVVTKPSEVMDVLLWAGNGSSTRSVSGLAFSPEFVWFKSRSNAYAHQFYDVVRGSGSGKNLLSNQTDAEGAGSSTYGYLSSFDSSGFSLAVGSDSTFQWGNQSSATYAAWCWDAGSSTVTDNTGSIQSTRRTNASAGFSVVTFNSGSSGQKTIGHGLGVAPEFIISKDRTNAAAWIIYHKSLGTTSDYLIFSTNAKLTSSNIWGSTAPSSTVFGFDSGTNSYSNADVVCYCFAPVAGYSAFGSYTGNGSADGPFVYTGFRPKWVMIKGSSFASNWNILDAARDPYNLQSNRLRPNLSNAEESSPSGTFAICWDALSNGFKLRGGSGTNDVNQTSETFIYFAVAESPFQYARAR